MIELVFYNPITIEQGLYHGVENYFMLRYFHWTEIAKSLYKRSKIIDQMHI